MAFALVYGLMVRASLWKDIGFDVPSLQSL